MVYVLLRYYVLYAHTGEIGAVWKLLSAINLSVGVLERPANPTRPTPMIYLPACQGWTITSAEIIC